TAKTTVFVVASSRAFVLRACKTIYTCLLKRSFRLASMQSGALLTCSQAQTHLKVLSHYAIPDVRSLITVTAPESVQHHHRVPSCRCTSRGTRLPALSGSCRFEVAPGCLQHAPEFLDRQPVEPGLQFQHPARVGPPEYSLPQRQNSRL